jgi:hypothetical protein
MQETLPLCPRPALSGLLRAGERLAACAGLGDAEGAQALSARAAVLVAHGPDGPVGAMGGPGRAHGLGRGPPAVAAPAPRRGALSAWRPSAATPAGPETSFGTLPAPRRACAVSVWLGTGAVDRALGPVSGPGGAGLERSPASWAPE